MLREKYALSDRECEIIALIAMGLTSEQISERLFLSKFTVDTHRKNIGRKTGASNPALIIKFAFENNITGEHLNS
ncbi:LuxR family transcriptional regulator [Segetibacter sp. 3557_3]|uniref:response regulator transcription factor n=1 Tax=Segetibacter sp. 3557_3 TaxID=2547429 RepID=UPI001058AB28|nr:helix-turn-helix transcriptional regulator [Segetibacter sp. 3557_3]TDH18393.1 LuxR family transcriptional regulator [Segetibacter sp. 3557_3]